MSASRSRVSPPRRRRRAAIEGDDGWQDAIFQGSLVPVASTVTVSDGEIRTLALRIRAG